MERVADLKGFFITFEGIDGCGKSTQAERLVEALVGQGYPTLHTREPGGTALGVKLRTMLLHEKEQEMAPAAELLLMAADRAQHVAEVIRPALQRGDVVVCERYVDSSVAYQGAAGVPLEHIAAVNAVATEGLLPDLTIWLDIDPEHTLVDGEADRIEERPLAYHQRVRQQYAQIWERAAERVVRLDVNGRAADDVHQAVLAIVNERLPRR